MLWQKQGLVFETKNLPSWAHNSALQPTPIVQSDRIRIFCGFRDEAGKSQVGFVDVALDNPMDILGVSEEAALEMGQEGTFDVDGVVPSAVIQRDGRLFLYYAGFSQHSGSVRFKAFCGLAVSNDGGKKFIRVQTDPVVKQSPERSLFGVIHSILKIENGWRVWYGSGSEFIQGENKSLPVYNIRYMDTHDGISFPEKGDLALDIRSNEHRLGRPYVIRREDRFHMFFGKGTETQPYQLDHAWSSDGKTWHRDGAIRGLELASSGWDSQMMAYPSVVEVNGDYYMFYNGNDYGRSGFGVAKLEHW